LGDGVEVGMGEGAEVETPGQVLAEQSVRKPSAWPAQPEGAPAMTAAARTETDADRLAG
jgi:hypothetical protein